MILPAQKVRVYWNLNRKCWSIKHKQKVIGYANTIFMYDVTFKVSEKGRQRVLKSKRKNVHAYAEGFISSVTYPKCPDYLKKRISYNPYRFAYFFDKDTEEKVEISPYVFLGEKTLTGAD
jgi:hypothetical protein